MDDDDTEPPMEGPGEEPQLYCKPIGVDADDASDGDGADASESRSDAGEPRLLEWNHFDLDPDNSPVIKVCGEDN